MKDGRKNFSDNLKDRQEEMKSKMKEKKFLKSLRKVSPHDILKHPIRKKKRVLTD